MADPQSTDQRIGEAETSIGVLQEQQTTMARLQRDTVQGLKEVKDTGYPPFGDVLRNAGIVAVLVTAILAGNRYLVNQQISEATKILEYRLGQAELELKQFKDQARATYTWKTVTEGR